MTRLYRVFLPSLCGLVILWSGARARAADVSVKPGDKVVTVQVRGAAQLERLLSSNLDIWSHHVGVGPVAVHVSAAELKKLKAAGFACTVENPDLFASHAAFMADVAARRAKRGAGDFENYKTFDEIVAFINNLAATRPDLCSVFSIGQSVEQRGIWVLHITGAGAGPKPGVFYHGLQHAREWITGPVVLYLAEHLVTNYDTDPCVADLVDRADIYLAPCVNPDGYVYTWTDDRFWRKNRRDNGDGTFGVDLNRNWAYGWGGGGSSSNPDDPLYHGTAPFSEPETAALSDFVEAHPNIRGYMDYHSYGQLVMWPFATTCTEAPPPDDELFWDLGTTMQSDILDVHGEFYEPGPICLTLYQASGASVDWNYGDQGRTAFTIELRPASPNPGFDLPPDQILPTCEENLPAILHLTEWATTGLVITLPGGPPEMLLADQPNAFAVAVTEGQEAYVPGSGMLNYRFDPGDAITATPLTELGGGNFSAGLPAAPCGATVEFYLSAQGDGGFVASDPCQAPINVYVAQYQEIIPVFGDDFEADLGWTTVNLANAGEWQRGVPVNDPGGQYDPASDSDGSGSCYLTQNVIGNSDVDNGSVILYSPVLDLSSGGAKIAYDYYLYLTNSDGADRLLVEIDGNGGAGPWVEIARHDTNGGTAWRHHEIATAYLAAEGVALTATMQLRFTANDSGQQSIVEAGLDAVAIVRLGCSAAPCGHALGDMNGDGTIDGSDVAGFVEGVIGGGDPCADLAAPAGVLDEADTAAFVAALLGS